MRLRFQMAARIDVLSGLVAGECYFAWPVVDDELRVVWVLAAKVPRPASDEKIPNQRKFGFLVTQYNSKVLGANEAFRIKNGS